MPERLLCPPTSNPRKIRKEHRLFARIPFAEQTTGLLLTFGDLRSAYVYLQATYETVDSATLNYAIVDAQDTASDWLQVTDDSYPFEFTVQLPDANSGFRFFVETVTPDGNVARSPETTLGKTE
jgi:hypothetical protein